ncbi:MAG: TaqI-like C-terminal specificity domain-containing protein, partial [Anaerolineaceae bacterium]
LRSTPPPEEGVGSPSMNPSLSPALRTLSKERADSLTPAQALNLRVVDPACGSGSFLLGAYQYLLDWHLNYYLSHDPQSHSRGKNPPLVAAEGGEYRLTTETKKRILTSSIYGVDIDAQAVEVTKLSLLLKLLEGETGQLALGFERVLPDLGQNIRCGNSLIGWDYFQGQMFPDEEEIHRVNPFDWQRAFPHVFASGGFDAVIGNPPYIRQESLGDDKPYYQSIYEVFTGTADIYSYFIEKGVKLLAPGGQFSYIVANKWLRARYGFKLRQWLKTKCIEEVTDFGDLPVFTGATTYPLILRVSNNPPHFQPRITNVKTLEFASLQEYVNEHGEISDQTCFEEDGWSLAGKQTQDLLAKIRQNSIPLGEYVGGKVYRGILTGLNKAFVIDQATKDRLITEDPRSAELIKPFAQGRDIKRYSPIPVKQYLILIPKGWTNQHRKGSAWNWFSSQYPAIANHLKQFEKEAIARGDKGDYWWELRACEYYEEFEKPKIVYPDISLRGNFTIELNGIHYGNTAYIMPVDDLFLLALLNSDLFDFCYRQMSSSYRGGYLRYIYQYVTQLPVDKIDKSNQNQLEIQKKITDLVRKYLALNQQQPMYPGEGHQLKSIKSEIEKQINLQIFDLYGLDSEEIRLVGEK